MATLKFTNVVDRTKDETGNDLTNLKYYGDLSENAKLEWDPIAFESFGKLMRTSNRAIATALREYYAKTFHDIRGVNLMYVPGAPTPSAAFVFELYFAKNSMPKPAEKIDNLTDLTVAAGDKTSLFYQKQIVDNKAAGKHYTLNDQTKLLLSDIMYGGRDANKPTNGRWNQYISEIWVPTSDWTFNPHAGELLIKVAGCFDIRRVLQKLFGNNMVTKTETYRDGDGAKAKNYSSEPAYEARFIKYAYNEPNVFIMNIEQFDKSAVEEINVKENPIRRSTVSGVIYY